MGTTLSGTTVSRGVLLSGAAQRALELDFGTGVLDSRITFSRGSHATVTDATGKLTYAPNNLLTNSESFEAAAWAKTNATVTANTVAAPDGTTTADTITTTTTNGQHTVESASVVIVGVTYVASVYVKANGSRYFTITNQGSALYGACFDLQTGTLAITAGANVTATSITSVGDGWYRVSVTSAFGYGRISFAINNSASNGFVNYAGDGTSGIYIWGAQLEAVTYQTTPSTYVSTTTKNLLGYTQEFDNAAWTKSNATAYPLDPATATQGPELVTNGDFSGGSTGWTVPAEWSIGSGVATKIAGAASSLAQDMTVSAGKAYLVTFTVTTISGGSFTPRLTGGTTVTGTSRTTAGVYQEILFAVSGNTTIGILGSTSGAGSIDNISVKELSGGLITAPDGSLTADKLVEDTAATSAHQVRATVSKNAVATPYTYSLYVKAAERSAIQMRIADASTSANRVICDVNLAAQTVSTSAGGTFTNVSATITSVGNDWFRVTLTGTSSTETSLFAQTFLANPSGTISYTGDGTSGIYLWGAQLSNSASVDPYVYNPVAAPSSTAYYGPRFDYDPVTLAPRGLLIEEQRQNLLLRSEEFDASSWAKASITVTANTNVAPDGNTTADTLTPSTTSSYVSQTATFTNDGDKSYSVFLKAGTSTTTRLTLRDTTSSVNRGSVDITWTAGVPSGVASVGTLQGIDSFGNGWYRVRMLATGVVAANTNQFRFIPSTSPETGTLIIWGAQAENGSFATSYIPTVASTVTRSADIATMTGVNFSNWYNQSEGTFVVKADYLNTFNIAWVLVAHSGPAATTNDYTAIVKNSSAINRQVISSSGVSQGTLDFAGAIVGPVYNLAGAYKTNDAAFTVNGATPLTDTTVTLPVPTSLAVGTLFSQYLNGHIRSIQYYSTRLPNIQLRTLTM